MLSTRRPLRRGTVAATQRVVAEFRSQGFDATLVRDEIDGSDYCASRLDGLDEVTIYVSCSEDEPDSPWRVSAVAPGVDFNMELLDVELPDMVRTSAAELVVRRALPFLSMTRQELLDAG